MEEQITYRFATPEDAELVFEFIRGIAVYERMEDQVVTTPEAVRETLFEQHCAEVLFAVINGEEVGFALFFQNYSTFLGKSGIYLEDLFVKPEARGKGAGAGLLKQLAKIAVERGCGRLEWVCLDGNKPSIDFYLSKGAEPLTEWTTYRLSGENLLNLAEQDQ